VWAQHHHVLAYHNLRCNRWSWRCALCPDAPTALMIHSQRHTGPGGRHTSGPCCWQHAPHQLALHRGSAALPRGGKAAALHCWRTLHTWATQHAPRLGLCTWLFMVSTIQAPAAPGHPPFQHWACCRCALPATLVHGGDGLQRLCKMCTTHTRAPCNAGAWHDPVRTNTRAVRLLPAAMQAATTPRGCAPLGLHNAVMRCGWCGCWSV
jgi:hypothetical protein